MRKILLIGGDLASGKSTYSQFLSQKFNVTVINKDVIKEVLGDNIYASNREENLKLSATSFQLIEYFIKTSKDNLIIESNFKQHEIDRLSKCCNENEFLTLCFTATNEILHQRFLTRLNENRHYVHKSQDFTDIKDFIKVLDNLRNVNYFGEVINVITDDFNHLYGNKQLLTKVENFLQK